MYNGCRLLPLSEVVHPVLLHSLNNCSKVHPIESPGVVDVFCIRGGQRSAFLHSVWVNQPGVQQRPAHARILLDGMSAGFCCKLRSTLNHCPFGISTSTENRCSAIMYRQIHKCAGLCHQGCWSLGMS